MSKGTGARMVVELDPELKKTLYAQLALEGLTFKGWLTREASRYVGTGGTRRLMIAETRTTYKAVPRGEE